MTLKEFEAEPGKISLHEFLALCHRWTERVRIRVVMGDAWLKFEEAANLGGEWVLTENAFAEEDGKWPELERLLKFYADAPVWNIVARLFQPLIHLMNRKYGKTGDLAGTVIEAHVHYEDIREGFLAEKDAIRRKCLDCCGGSAKLVDECNVYTCPLYEWRDGKPKRTRPETGQITLDEWQKERRYGGTIPV